MTTHRTSVRVVPGLLLPRFYAVCTCTGRLSPKTYPWTVGAILAGRRHQRSAT